METSPNVSKRKKDVLQSDSTITGEAGTLPFALSNPERNAYWGTEPNFNLNLNLMSPSNPRSLLEATKQHGGSRKDGNKKSGKSGVKGAAETSKFTDICATPGLSSGEKEDPPQQRSRIPGLSHSLTVNTKGEQRLKSPNPKHTSTLSPKMQSHNMMAGPKPQQLDQTTIDSSSKTTEQIKIQTQKTESTINHSVIPRIVLKTESTSKTATEIPESSSESLKVQTNNKNNSGNVVIDESSQQILHHSGSSKVHRGDANVKTPRLANRATTTANPKISKADPESTARKSNEQTSHESRTPLSDLLKSSEDSKLHCQSEMSFLNTRTTQQGSLSPNPSTQKKATTARNTNTNASGSKDSLDSNKISTGSQSKTSSKCSSNLKTPTSKDSLLSEASLEGKTSPSTKAEMGSQDSLESKSRSDSKTSWGSKDNLDSKSGSNPKPSCRSKSGTGSRDTIASKTVSEVKGNSASKTSFDYKMVVVFKSHLESKNDLYPKSQIPLAPKCSSSLKISSRCNTGSKDSLLDSGSKNSNLKTSGSNTKSNPGSNASSDTSNAGPVQSSSTSLSEASPRTGSPTRGVGKWEHQRTPGSAPGLLTPLATSSPKTITVATVMGESTMKPITSVTNGTKPSHVPKNTNLKPYDSITKTPGKTVADNEKDNIKVTECKIPALREPVPSQGAVRGVDMTDSTDIQLRKPSNLGDANAIAAGGNIHSSETTNVETANDNKKQQDRVKQRNNPGSALLSPSLRSHPANTVKRITVNEAATMTDSSVRQKEVGVQVEIEMTECSASTSPNLSKGALTSSLIGSPSCQSGSLTSPMVPSLCCIPASQPPPFQHICKIEIELHSQSVLPSVLGDKASSLPSCFRTYSFQKSPALMPKLSRGPNKDRNMGAKSVLEDEEEKDKGTNKEGVEDKKKVDEMVKPQNVVWDEQGMTWEIYGASVDLESLGTAIQSHLESKIREQEKHIRTLRKSICSDLSPRAWKIQKGKKRKGGILGCCRKASPVAD
ncbi:uncharacterized protein LOC115438658 isoform X2 [Sphaeramia orbicularis]|uniref:uncharacterized protein LOC115438658 isoform X2 n=1 Tax=Sphaeramia orbicularis TaxID=375764 RepID=UPI00117EE262|nr:uncharacterized protein LOC115438658 isoform X2 [Sphaeramia orbicularis]